MILNNDIYDKLKWVGQFLLPSMSALYFALSEIWNLPHTEAIVGTIMALSVFVGAILGLGEIGHLTDKSKNGFLSVGHSEAVSSVSTEKPSLYFPLSSKVYDVLKWGTLFLLPAVGTLYFTVSAFWNLPYGGQVQGTVAALTAFLGLFLGINKAQYQKTKEIV